ncbi:hypothetical protein BURK2_04248 [Burkholderiales bacterium]|nr:MAG: hypothetical protein F9K47_19155 [Burkholderiales bacterium]CAG1011387.1 hypothetical protein BURK2_04248 [Burkholderiales bacterium]
MHFMFLILAILLYLVVWGLFQTNPKGVPKKNLLIYNLAVLVVAATLGPIVGYYLYLDASVVRAHDKGLPAYLGIMAGGTAFLIVVAAAGMVRNLVVFPLSRRQVETPADSNQPPQA